MRNANRRFHRQPGGNCKRVSGRLGGDCSKGYEFSTQSHRTRLRRLQQAALRDGLADGGSCGDHQPDVFDGRSDEGWDATAVSSAASGVENDMTNEERSWQGALADDDVEGAQHERMGLPEVRYPWMVHDVPTANEHLQPDTAEAVKAAWHSGCVDFYPNGNPWEDGQYHSLREILDCGEWPLYVDFTGPMGDSSDDDEGPCYHFDDLPGEASWEEHAYFIWAQLWCQSNARHWAARRTHRDRQFIELHGRLKRSRARFGCDRPSEPYAWSRDSHFSGLERMRGKMVAADIAEGLRERRAAVNRELTSASGKPASFVNNEMSIELPYSGAFTLQTRKRGYVTTHTHEGRLTCAHAGQRRRSKSQR